MWAYNINVLQKRKPKDGHEIEKWFRIYNFSLGIYKPHWSFNQLNSFKRQILKPLMRNIDMSNDVHMTNPMKKWNTIMDIILIVKNHILRMGRSLPPIDR